RRCATSIEIGMGTSSMSNLSRRADPVRQGVSRNGRAPTRGQAKLDGLLCLPSRPIRIDGSYSAAPDTYHITSPNPEAPATRSVPAWPARSDWCFATGIWGEMAREDWDVIHVQSYHTLVAPLAMMRALNLRLPYCVTFHGGGHSSLWRNRMRRDQLRALRPLL